MAITNKQFESITEQFEKAFANNEIGDLLRTEDEPTYEYIVNEALEEEGFPQDANHYNVNHTLMVSEGTSLEDWTERFVNDFNIETSEEVKVANTEDNVNAYILDNIDNTKTDVLINDELEEWIEEHGTEEYLEQRMEEFFDEHEFGEMLEQNATDEVNEKIKEALQDEGFPENTKPDDVSYLVDYNSIKIEIPFADLAEQHIDDVESQGTVQNYLERRFYEDILDTGKYDFDIEVTSDPEDFEEA